MQPPLTLIDTFRDLPDPRQLAQCEHRLADLPVIAAFTLLSGGESLRSWNASPAPGWTGAWTR